MKLQLWEIKSELWDKKSQLPVFYLYFCSVVETKRQNCNCLHLANVIFFSELYIYILQFLSLFKFKFKIKIVYVKWNKWHKNENKFIK